MEGDLEWINNFVIDPAAFEEYFEENAIWFTEDSDPALTSTNGQDESHVYGISEDGLVRNGEGPTTVTLLQGDISMPEARMERRLDLVDQRPSVAMTRCDSGSHPSYSTSALTPPPSGSLKRKLSPVVIDLTSIDDEDVSPPPTPSRVNERSSHKRRRIAAQGQPAPTPESPDDVAGASFSQPRDGEPSPSRSRPTSGSSDEPESARIPQARAEVEQQSVNLPPLPAHDPSKHMPGDNSDKLMRGQSATGMTPALYDEDKRERQRQKAARYRAEKARAKALKASFTSQ